MSKEYTGFPIANFRVGFDEALEPWLLPRDGYQVLRNGHLYRGVVEKIPGYTFFARMSYRQSVALTGLIDGANKTYTGTLTPVPSTTEITVRSTINAGATLSETFVSDSSGVLTGSNGGSGTVNLATGAVSVTFGAAAPADLTVGGVQYNSVVLTYDGAPAAYQPIMGIQPYYNPNGSQDVMIFDTRRVGKIVVLTGDIAEQENSDYGISELPHEAQALAITTGFNNTTGPFTGTLASAFLVPGEVTFQVFDGSTPTANLLGTITDNGSGLLTGALLNGAAQNLINYATGQWRMTFLANRPATDRMNFSGCIYGDIFTGTFSNFFVVVNYQGKAFLTNSVDAPMYYDGSCVKFLNTNLSVKLNTVAPYDISRVLHLAVNRERLLLIAYYENLVPVLNGINWSRAGDPLDFTNDEQELAPTSEPIRTFSFINTDMVVRFSNSERIFRYTGDEIGPFRWDSTNLLWRCDAPYSAINYDSWFSSVGRPAIVGSDGVNVKRVDEIIPDFTLNLRVPDQQPVLSIDQQSIAQCYGVRYDDFKEGWLCYRSYNDDYPAGIKPSDAVLAFNYLDSTYAVYTFPFSCLGFGRILSVDTWDDNFDTWYSAEYTWDSYSQSEGALIDLAGDQNGIVYEVGNGSAITDEDGVVIPCLFEAITKDFNPFVEAGELARLGYVDLLMSSNENTTFRVQFYKDNLLDDDFNTYYQESILQLPGAGQSKVWKRIYVGAVGKEHTMRIYQNAADFETAIQNQPLRIHAIVPYFKAAGRIFS